MTRILPPSALCVERRLFDQLMTHLTAEAPLEGVGLLATVADGDAARATCFYPGTNIDASTSRYTMDPVEVLGAFADMEANRWDFGAIVHSHPLSPPVPSATDLREAFYPDQLLLIVGLATQPPMSRSWSVRRGEGSERPTVTEVPVIVEENMGGVSRGTEIRLPAAAARIMNAPMTGHESRRPQR